MTKFGYHKNNYIKPFGAMLFICLSISCNNSVPLVHMGLEIYTSIDHHGHVKKNLSLISDRSYKSQKLNHYSLSDSKDSSETIGIWFQKDQQLILSPRVRYYKNGISSIFVKDLAEQDSIDIETITLNISSNKLIDTTNKETFYKVDSRIPYPYIYMNSHLYNEKIDRKFRKRMKKEFTEDQKRREKQRYIEESQI